MECSSARTFGHLLHPRIYPPHDHAVCSRTYSDCICVEDGTKTCPKTSSHKPGNTGGYTVEQKGLRVVWHKPILGLFLLLILIACTSQPFASSGATPVPTPMPTVRPIGNTSEQVEHDPLVQQLRADLHQRGVELTAPDTSRVAWLSTAPGLAYRVGAGWLHVHAYPDTAAAEANAAQIPPSADTGMTDWVAPPHFFRCDRVIVLYLGQEQHIPAALTELCGPQFAGFQP